MIRAILFLLLTTPYLSKATIFGPPSPTNSMMQNQSVTMPAQPGPIMVGPTPSTLPITTEVLTVTEVATIAPPEPPPIPTTNGDDNRARLLKNEYFLIHSYYKTLPLRKGKTLAEARQFLSMLSDRWSSAELYIAPGSWLTWVQGVRAHVGSRFSMGDGFWGLNAAEILGICRYEAGSPCLTSVQGYLASRVMTSGQAAQVSAAAEEFNTSMRRATNRFLETGLTLKIVLVPFQSLNQISVDTANTDKSVGHVVATLTDGTDPSEALGSYETWISVPTFGSQPVLMVPARLAHQAGHVRGPNMSFRDRCRPIGLNDATMRNLLNLLATQNYTATYNDIVRYAALQALYDQTKRVGGNLSDTLLAQGSSNSGIFMRGDIDTVRDFVDASRTVPASSFKRVALAFWNPVRDYTANKAVACDYFYSVAIGYDVGLGSFWGLKHSSYAYTAAESAFIDNFLYGLNGGIAPFVFLFGQGLTYGRNADYQNEYGIMDHPAMQDVPSLLSAGFSGFSGGFFEPLWQPWKP